MTGGALTANPRVMEEGFRQYMYLTGEIANSLKTLATVGVYGGDSALRNMFKSCEKKVFSIQPVSLTTQDQCELFLRKT